MCLAILTSNKVVAHWLVFYCKNASISYTFQGRSKPGLNRNFLSRQKAIISFTDFTAFTAYYSTVTTQLKNVLIPWNKTTKQYMLKVLRDCAPNEEKTLV